MLCLESAMSLAGAKCITVCALYARSPFWPRVPTPVIKCSRYPTRLDIACARRSVFDLSLSGRPGPSKAEGGGEKTKTRKQRGAGAPALRIRPRREKNPDLDHEIS